MSDDEHVVHPMGELDIAAVPALRDQWLRAIDGEQAACSSSTWAT